MSVALVLVEHEGGAIKDATLATVTAAAQLGEVHALVAGEGVGAVAEAAAKLAGVTKVHVADGAAFAHNLAENVAPVAAQLVRDHCDWFVAPATTTGKNIAPRVAALLDVMQVSDILSVEGPDTFTRPIYAGNAIASSRRASAPAAPRSTRVMPPTIIRSARPARSSPPKSISRSAFPARSSISPA